MLKGSLNNGGRQNIKRLSFVPTLDEINVNMVQALSTRGRAVELHWIDPDSNIEYKLGCLCKLTDGSTPRWELLVFQEGLWHVVLRHESTDTILMFNSIMDAVGRNDNKAQSDGAMYANSARYLEGDKISDSFRHFATSTKLRKTDVDAIGALLEDPTETFEGYCSNAEDARTASTTAADPTMPLFEQINEQKVVECFQDLLKFGLQPTSVLMHSDSNASSASIRKILGSGLPVDIDAQINLYSAINGQLSINELILSFNWGRKQWVPIVWNLINCNLVTISLPGLQPTDFSAPETGTAPPPAAVNNLYRESIDRVKNGFLDPVSGLYTFDAMLFFLEYEAKRVRRTRQAVTLFVFKANLKHQRVQQLIAHGIQIDQLIVQAVDQVKRSDEILAHFDTNSYGIVMPSTRQSGASQAIHRFLRQLAKMGLGPDPTSGAPPICIAVLSMPDHANDLAELISVAKAELVRVESLCAVAP